MIVRTLVAAMALVAATQARAVEVRACGELRSTPLSDERNVQSGLLQAFAVVNTDSAPVTLTGVRFELKKGGKTTDTRWLHEDDIARVVRQGPMVAAVAKMIPSQFCSGAMLAGTTSAKSATLAPGEALVFLHQPFLWQGARDALNIAAVTVKDRVSRESLVEVRISGAAARTQALFPVAGRSYVAVAASLHTPHRWLAMEEFALDIAMLGKGGSTHRGDGTRMTDFAAFGQPIRAVANGKVVRVASATPDNVAMLIRTGESADAYLARLLEAQNALIAKGIEAVLGNHVVIDHGNGEYSVYAHLKQGSPRVMLGQQVKAGETIGALGSSGNSTEPHLHFQMCDNPDMNQCHALQPVFHGFRLPLELTPRTIQSGDIVETIDDPS
jgi:Peptidase family M23